jgi:aminoglycoside 2'-N-acetyltransferase I
MVLELMTVPSEVMSREQAAAVIALCGAVFNIDYAYLMDLCPVRTHVLGCAAGRLVAHALWLDRRMRIGDGPWITAAYVEGVATHPEHRRRGYGEAVMRRLQGEIGAYPLGALSPAVELWYLRLGWERWLGPLWIDRNGVTSETLDETVLVYRTPRTETLDLALALTAQWRPFELW